MSVVRYTSNLIVDTLSDLTATLGQKGDTAFVLASSLTYTNTGGAWSIANATNFKTINGTSILGTGDLTISGGSGGAASSVVTVTTLTINAIQTAYNNIPSGSTATIFLSGTYLRTGTETLNITDSTKTVTFRSLDGARLHDPNNTATQFPLVGINNQTGGGWEGIRFSTASNYSAFNYGLVLLNETAPTTNYTFRHCSFTAPNLKGNACTVLAYSQDNNGGAGSGSIHKNIQFDHCRFFDVGRMGLEWVSHNELESGRPTRIFGATVTGCKFSNCGLVDKNGMGCSFSGSLEDVIHTNNRYELCKQYCVEFIGTRSGLTGNNYLSSTLTWGDGTNGTGTFLTNGYNFTDGNNSGLGAKNITIQNDEINVNGRPFLSYGCSNLNFIGGTWRGGLYIDINKGSKSDGTGDPTLDLTMIGCHIAILGATAQNVITINNSQRVQFINLNLLLNNPTANQNYSVLNAENTCSYVNLTGGSFRRPNGSQDNMYNIRALNSPTPVAPMQTTF